MVAPGRPDDVAADVEVLAGSGLFDAEFYALANADVLAAGEDPLEHFCRVGWHELRNPRPDFDLWWYWVEHLDSTRDLVNPLVHFVEEGRRVGLPTQPDGRRDTPAQPRHPHRRICLFASHDRDGFVDDTVVTYVRALSRVADVYFLADNELDPAELAKLGPHVHGAWAVRHGAYDFGSYSLLARELVGWDVVGSYDELLLVNDSCYLLRNLDDLVKTMDSRACDWWGLQATLRHFSAAGRDERDGPVPLEEIVAATKGVPPRYDDHLHVGSYFLAFRSPVIHDPRFRRRLDTVVAQEHKRDLVRRYETGFSRYLLASGFGLETYVQDVHPFHPVYSATAWQLVGDGFPLLKRQLLASNPLATPDIADWKERLAGLAPDAQVEEMERHLLRTADPVIRHRAMSIVTHGQGRRLSTPWHPDALRVEDALTPTFDHWWAFPAAADGVLSPDAWAVLAATLDDPTLRKVVLTRTRHLEVAGVNVVLHPLGSREGQWHLMRSGRLVASDPGLRAEDLGLVPSLHRVEFLASRAGPPPRLDLITCSSHDLPEQLQREERALALRIDARPFLLWMTDEDGSGTTPDELALARLGRICRSQGVVVGVRGPRSQFERDAVLEPLGPVDRLDVFTDSFPHLVVLLRAARACLTDSERLARDLAWSGCPMLRPGDPAGALDALRASADPMGRTHHAERVVRQLRRQRSANALFVEAIVDPLA